MSNKEALRTSRTLRLNAIYSDRALNPVLNFAFLSKFGFQVLLWHFKFLVFDVVLLCYSVLSFSIQLSRAYRCKRIT